MKLFARFIDWLDDYIGLDERKQALFALFVGIPLLALFIYLFATLMRYLGLTGTKGALLAMVILYLLINWGLKKGL